MSETEPPTYSIRDVRDFLLVPADRRDECLHEFAVWLGCHELMLTLMDEPGQIKLPDEFAWLDDGKRQIKATIHAGDEKIVMVKGLIKKRAQCHR